MGLPIPMCQDQTMQLEGLIFLGTTGGSYWVAGVLTVLASSIVVSVMLLTSRADDEELF